MIKISPSILSADFSKLGEEIKNIEKAGADYIHIDVMDGSFVPNITIGNEVVRALRPVCNLPYDVHLMINNPDNHIKAFAEAGSDIITIHAEASIHLDRSLALIKSFNKKAGVSLVPSTHEDALDYILEKLDLILVMTVLMFLFLVHIFLALKITLRQFRNFANNEIRNLRTWHFRHFCG